MSKPTRRRARCIGFGPLEGKCQRERDELSALWCVTCEAARRAHISRQLDALAGRMEAKAKEAKA